MLRVHPSRHLSPAGGWTIFALGRGAPLGGVQRLMLEVAGCCAALLALALVVRSAGAPAWCPDGSDSGCQQSVLTILTWGFIAGVCLMSASAALAIGVARHRERGRAVALLRVADVRREFVDIISVDDGGTAARMLAAEDSHTTWALEEHLR